jgi:hypothetical protein
MKRGTLNVMVGAMPCAIDVYDDGLVVVSGSKGAQAGMMFGALGALIGGAAARRVLAKRREQLDALQATSAAQAASVEGCEMVAPSDIQSITVKKGLGSGRRMRVDRSTGRKLTFVYNAKKQPTSELDALLRPLLGDRLQLGAGT